MNEYLTTKCDHNRKDIAVLIGMGLLLYGCIKVLVDGPGEGEEVNIGVNVLLTALCLWPIARVLLRWDRRKKARQIALRVSGMAQSELSLHQADSVLGMPRAAKTIQMLIAKGYLKNLSVDGQRGCIVLEIVKQKADEIQYVTMICPHCGAGNTVPRGRVGQCRYCNNALTDGKEKHS